MKQSPAASQTDQPKRPVNAPFRVVALALAALLVFGFSACGKPAKKPVPATPAAVEAVESRLFKAATKDEPEEIKALLDSGENINAIDILGRTPLHIAAFYGHLQVSKLLIERGAEINARDRVGMTALHAAVLSGGRQEVELLLANKADLHARSDAGQTALHLAAATGQPKLSRYLIEQGADPQSKDADGKTPLSYAMQNQHPLTTALFKQYSAKN